MEPPITRKDGSQGSTEEVLRGVKARATRMALQARRDPARGAGAIARMGKQLGILNVAICAGFVHVAFVLDQDSRRIVGWRVPHAPNRSRAGRK